MTQFVLFKEGQAVYLSDESPFTGTPALKVLHDAAGNVIDYDDGENSFLLKSHEHAIDVADRLSKIMGKTFIACDNGDCTSHRFGVMEIPLIGDEVSRGFNGDYYPCGKITKITPTLRITTESGARFSRVRETSSWREIGRGFYMVAGVHDERNPHF